MFDQPLMVRLLRLLLTLLPRTRFSVGKGVRLRALERATSAHRNAERRPLAPPKSPPLCRQRRCRHQAAVTALNKRLTTPRRPTRNRLTADGQRQRHRRQKCLNQRRHRLNQRRRRLNRRRRHRYHRRCRQNAATLTTAAGTAATADRRQDWQPPPKSSPTNALATTGQEYADVPNTARTALTTAATGALTAAAEGS